MPELDYSIRIVDTNGNGVANRKVQVHYPYTTDSDITDDNGWVSFNKSNISYEWVDVSVYVDGDLLGKVSIEDGDTISFTI